MKTIPSVWLRWRDSLWFVPSLIVAGCIGLALLLIDTQTRLDVDLADEWPRLFGAGAEGARGVLSAIATSMITVAGVVFSVTIVALSLASSQYSPSVLRNFMNDRPTQTVLGAFVGIFAYCLIVLRTVREPGSGDFLPSLAVLGGVVLALLGVAMLIYFIHHVATSIQAPSIVGRIAASTAQAIDQLYPDPIGEAQTPLVPPAGPWREVPAPATGYIVAVDDAGLLDFAAEVDRVVRLAHRVGDFVIEGRRIADVAGDAPLSDAHAGRLQDLLTIEPERSVHQDAGFGLQQLGDVAVKALSPGINDPSTAVAVIDHLTALLVRLAGRRIPPAERGRHGTLRVIAPGPDFDRLLGRALLPLVDHARGERAVLERLLDALATLADETRSPPRRQALCAVLDVLAQRMQHDVALVALREALLARAALLTRRLRSCDAT